MISLHCEMLLSSNFRPESLQHHTNLTTLKPFCTLGTSTVPNFALIDRRSSNQRYPQTHLSDPPKNRKDFAFGSVEKAHSEECVFLVNKYGKFSKHIADCRQLHARFLKLDSFRINSSLRKKLVVLYSKKKDMLDYARKLFDEIAERTIPLYSALMGSYGRAGKWGDVLLVFGFLVNEGRSPDRFLVPTILKACSATKDLRCGKMIHGYVIRKGLVSELFVGNALIDFYSNCGDLESCGSVFDTMQERDVVSWTNLFSAYMDRGLLDEAEETFLTMQVRGVKPDLISWNARTAGFAQNGKIHLAYLAIKQMHEAGFKSGVGTWNGIISGCVQSGNFGDALDAFRRMLRFPEEPNVITIVSILSAFSGMRDLKLGTTIHGCALKRDLCWNSYVQESLVIMYSQCGRIDSAKKIFLDAEEKDTTMWNAMIDGHVNEGKMDVALGLLRSMQNDGLTPDVITYNTLIGGYARSGQKTQALGLLSEMIDVGVKPNTVSFNVLLSGLQQSGLTYEALKLFRSMQSGSFGGCSTGVLNLSVKQNHVAVASALAACADLNFLRQGKELHGYIVRNRFGPNIYISSALVDIYAKCHDLCSAEKVFWRIEDRNTVAWNAYIAGYISNSRLEDATELFYRMLGEGINPSPITYKTLMPVCGDMETLRVRRELHGHIIKCQIAI